MKNNLYNVQDFQNCLFSLICRREKERKKTFLINFKIVIWTHSSEFLLRTPIYATHDFSYSSQILEQVKEIQKLCLHVHHLHWMSKFIIRCVKNLYSRWYTKLRSKLSKSATAPIDGMPYWLEKQMELCKRIHKWKRLAVECAKWNEQQTDKSASDWKYVLKEAQNTTKLIKPSKFYWIIDFVNFFGKHIKRSRVQWFKKKFGSKVEL